MVRQSNQQKTDIDYMKRALRLAKKGEGMVSPNPLVGAVLVKNNQIIGEGYHQKYGEAHAEINAINTSWKTIKGSTLYCTLEPCCHTDKQTPPCVNRIIKEGIKRVVVASEDPNPKVRGKGFRILREAGVEVSSGILADKNESLNKFYFHYVRTKRPYVTLKIAQSLDGYISDKKNKQLWLTGKKAQRMVHRWRSVYDSVIVGANTLRVDKPKLTVRYGKVRNPIRIILTTSANINPDSQIFSQKPVSKTWMITTKQNQPRLVKKLSHTGCEIIGLSPDGNHSFEISSLLKYLGKQKITSVLVEGGQQIFSQFLQSGLSDEINIIVAPKILGKGIKAFNIENDQQLSSFRLHRTKKTDEDLLLNYLLK